MLGVSVPELMILCAHQHFFGIAKRFIKPEVIAEVWFVTLSFSGILPGSGRDVFFPSRGRLGQHRIPDRFGTYAVTATWNAVLRKCEASF